VSVILTFGETMAALRSEQPLRLGGSLRLSVAGAESNVAIGLARLGHPVRWAGRVGADELGALIVRTLRAEGVDTGGDQDRSRTGHGPAHLRRARRDCRAGDLPAVRLGGRGDQRG
jgi:sugar/nucleoside kinase (ribokinase family)